MLAFSAFPELKQVILVDEDVDIFDMKDVMWTRPRLLISNC
nr:UbiD family decarboxylase domain-containing protein [uncultured Phascolarctobacterium sp.]